MRLVGYIDLFIGAVINFIIYMIIIKKLFKHKFCENKIKFIISLISIGIIVSFINVFNKTVFKILLTMPFVIVTIKVIFNINYKNAITYAIVATLYTFTSEILVIMSFSLLPFDYTFIFNNVLGTTIGALCVGIYTIMLLLLKKLNNKVIYFVKNINEKDNLILYILIFIAIGAFGYKNVINVYNHVELIMNAVMFITFIIIFSIYIEENVKLKELSNNYNELFNYLEKYEKELVEKRKIIHDYKNQIIVINSYIGNENKLNEYIKELIEEYKNIKENSIIKNIDKLPQGIKGLIYYKFSHIKEDIIVDLQIKNKLSKFDNLSPKLNKDVLKIIGILIDNAIDAVNIEKEKYINIEFSLIKNIFKVEIKNPCTKELKIDNLMKVGYSTKGKNRGYGLALVKDIIKQESIINFNLIIEDNEFRAILEVKI